MSAPDTLRVISDAYSLLLMALPPGHPFRDASQSVYAGLRDCLSEMTGVDAERIQELYERNARLATSKLEGL